MQQTFKDYDVITFKDYDVITVNDKDYVISQVYDNLLYCYNLLDTQYVKCFDVNKVKMSNNQFIKLEDFKHPIHLVEKKEHDLFGICCNDLSFDYTKWAQNTNNLLMPVEVSSIYNNYYSFRTNKVTCEDCLNYVKLRDL